VAGQGAGAAGGEQAIACARPRAGLVVAELRSLRGMEISRLQVIQRALQLRKTLLKGVILQPKRIDVCPMLVQFCQRSWTRCFARRKVLDDS
jgi:hypothetical protein